VFAAVLLASAGHLSSAFGQTKPSQPWVSRDANGRLVYRVDEHGNRIPDFSMVGYRSGNVPLPGEPGGAVVPVRVTLEPGSGDQTRRIQDAINTVAKLPRDRNGFRGAVLLRAGEYPCEGQILLNASGVVLRGEGADRASGSVLRSTSKQQIAFLLVSSKSKPIVDPAAQTIVDDYVPVGATRFSVPDPAAFKPGDTVLVVRPGTMEWLKLIGATKPGVDWTIPWATIRWDRVVVSVRGRVVTLDAPITTALDRKYGGGTIAKYAWPERIEDIGIEDLHLTCDVASKDDEAHAWRGIQIESAQNVYVKRVEARHFAYAHTNTKPSSKWVTIQDVRNLDPVSRLEGARRYPFCLDGQLGLVRRAYSSHGRHDFVCNDYFVAGPNVFLDCKAENCHSESGPHRHWSSGILFDNVDVAERISLYHRHNYGRKEKEPPYHLGHGWASASVVAWKCRVKGLLLVQSPPGARNWAIGCVAGSYKGNGEFESNGTPHPIRSLYEAQLEERRRCDQ
jgi:hypothetical protein